MRRSLFGRSGEPWTSTSFSYADPSDPPVKRGLIRLVERATGQPELKRLYVHNQLHPGRTRVSGRQRCVRWRWTCPMTPPCSRGIPKTGPVVFVCESPLRRTRRHRHFLARREGAPRLRGPDPRRAEARLGGARLRVADRLSGTEEAQEINLKSRAAARRQLDKGGAVIVFPRRRGLDRARSARPPSRGRRTLATLCLATHSAFEGDRRSDLVRRPERPSVSDRQPCQPDAADLAHFSRGQSAHRRPAARRDRSADTVRSPEPEQGPSGACRRPSGPAPMRWRSA